MLRRWFPLVSAICLGILFIVASFRVEWRSLPQSFGLGEVYGSPKEQVQDEGDSTQSTGTGGLPGEAEAHAWKSSGKNSDFKEPKVDAKSPYPIGTTKPAGSNYTRTVVMARMIQDDTSWVQKELGDMIDAGLLKTAIYVMNDPEAPFHPIQNKGHEVMAYLSYIIDHYDDLPDITLFMHYHRYAWHNNKIMNEDASQMIRYLSAERVTREGYMNLRCHWYPGCPAWLHPGAIDRNYWKQEEHILANAWTELFPKDPIPQILAQPCCAQFAVSRERILAIPKPRFVWLQDWILRTDFDDFISGRIFEYTWQYIFTSSPLHCPSMSVCYCDGYGFCFGDPERFDYYFELQFKFDKYLGELDRWETKAEEVADAHEQANDGKLNGEEILDIPEVGQDRWLKEELEKIGREMADLRKKAFERGKDPKQRAKEAGREWREGNGF